MDISALFLAGASVLLLLLSLAGLFGPHLILYFCPAVQKHVPVSPFAGSVSVIIPLHDQYGQLEHKISTIAAQLQPARDEILIVLDGPIKHPPTGTRPDGLDVHGLPPLDTGGVAFRILALPKQGKNTALNAAGGKAKGDIVLITDRDARVTDGALLRLLEPFACQDVGLVCGHLKIEGKNATAQQKYWGGESRLKLKENTRLGNLTASNGSLLAVRRELYPYFPEGMADDIFAVLNVRKAGFRTVFAPEAVVFSPPRRRAPGEVMKRQRRIVGRGLRALFAHKELLNPLHYGAFSLVLCCHKLLRRLAPFFLFAAICLAGLALPGCWPVVVIGGQLIGFFLLLWLVMHTFAKKEPENRLMAKVLWLCAVIIGVCAGVFTAISGNTARTWD